MTITQAFARLAAAGAGLAALASTAAAQQPTGVWIDHTGRGAVEIAECDGGLCGHVVWIKDSKNKSACRTQIIGNARPVGSNTWDRGWILDPDDNKRYSVELKPVGGERLRVTGYMGSKLFSETMMWKRAPADLKRCDVTETAVPAAPPAPLPVVTPMPTPATQTAALPTTAPAVPAAPERVRPAEQAITPFGTPPREASAPAPVPSAVPPSPAVQPPASAPAAVQAEVTETTAAPKERRPRRQASDRSRGRECTLDLPYITLKYPCDAF
jgi:uncharacterized protein (DUF2147 family)